MKSVDQCLEKKLNFVKKKEKIQKAANETNNILKQNSKKPNVPRI